MLIYLRNIDIGTTNPPYKKAAYKIGAAGKYFIKGLINDPNNSFVAYLFTVDNNVASGTFGVFKMNFTVLPYKYIYTALSMSAG